jgi:DNA invertase Pin-like site-specific DNA recombinase
MPEQKRVAIYARVSTDRQTNENQMLDLRRFCSMRGWSVVQEFVDDGISGSKKNRPKLDQLMAFVRNGRCDCVLVWRYDRFARSGSHLVNTLEAWRECGVDFASYHEGIDTTTAQGKFFFMVVAGFAEFERSLIIDRINSGLRRARSCKGCGQQQSECRCQEYVPSKILGRPGVSKSKIAEIIALRGSASIRAIAARTGISKSVVQKVLSLKPSENVASAIDGTPVAF